MFPILVFDRVEARAKRGEDAKEMLACPDCGLIAGVLVSEIKRMSCDGRNKANISFSTLIWERWQCLNCRNIWIEKYGVSERVQEDKVIVQEDNRRETTR